jgi:hypothetical protein
MSDDTETRGTRVLANGAVYDLDKHRIVSNPGGGRSAITSETASQMQAIARERKRQAMATAANAAVLRDDWRVSYGDLAYAAAIADTAMIKATTPDDPKAIDAARFLLQETALSEPRTQEQAQAQVPAAIHALAELLRAVTDAIAERDMRDDASAAE